MSDTRISELVEQAFGYRGHVTVQRHDGSKLIGYVYDRDPAHVEMFDEQGTSRIRIAIREIADITLTGEDCAATSQRNWERRHGRLESQQSSAWGDWEERATLILTALPIELHSIASALGAPVRGATACRTLGDDRVVARAIGVGGGAAQIVAAERPRLVISCGLAGALVGSLRSGDLVLASSVRDESGDRVIARESVLRVVRDALSGCGRLVEGELLCTTRIAATRDDKRALAHPSRCAVDLESWTIAQAADRAHIPWLALRVVLDPLDVDLPAFAGEVRADYVTSMLRYAFSGPRPALAVVRLGLRASLALRSLQRAMQALAPVLGALATAEERA
jgi:adenosylhomocysteine nucleosidase